MKIVQNSLQIILVFGLATISCAHKSSKEKPEYECSVKFVRYRLDREPKKYGLAAGKYAPGKTAYVGLGVWNNQILSSGRIQLHPAGMYRPGIFGPAIFDNSSEVWYLSPRSHQKFKWVRSSKGNRVPFAINLSLDCCASSIFIGRIRKNGYTFLGNTLKLTQTFYYVDGQGQTKLTKNDYEVLTCQTSRRETKIPMPKYTLGKPRAPGQLPSESCNHNWVPYEMDKAPEIKGIWAGKHNCNDVYVGKGMPVSIFIAGRIHTTGDVGFYSFFNDAEVKVDSQVFYLADNPNYTYKWIEYQGANPPNAVMVDFAVPGSPQLSIGRVNVNGQVRVGPVIEPILLVLNDNGTNLEYRYHLEVLVCDPVPKYQCGQQWKKLDLEVNDLPSVDGFSVGSSFIGRKLVRGSDYAIGTFDARSSQFSYLDEMKAEAAIEDGKDCCSAEYLVKDPSNSYAWKPSRKGEKVPNAVELQREGHAPFYIGRLRVNDDFFVGKVKPGEGLFFVGVDGNLKTSSSYDVLTCTSADKSRGLYEERSDSSWFGPFGCPIRKEWSFAKWRCVCRKEFKGLLVSEQGTWNEDTCSYV